jgi:hypothetical protein
VKDGASTMSEMINIFADFSARALGKSARY